jgi:hypothetical protein
MFGLPFPNCRIHSNSGLLLDASLEKATRVIMSFSANASEDGVCAVFNLFLVHRCIFI